MKSKSTAAILAFFLGGLGIHRFYLGQGGLGLVYLLFCWTFIPMIIAFIDFIRFLLMSDDEFNMKYNPAFYASTHAPSQNANTISINLGGEQHTNPTTASQTEEMERLYALKQKGIITDEEFENHKHKLLTK